MRKIDFLCIGAQKAGTTTLHDILNQNPDLCLPQKKETHFFSRETMFSQGKNYYKSFFDIKSQHRFFGEIDPEYSYFSDSAKKIYEMFGMTKIIFIIRNPVERAFSHYLMTKRRGLETLSFEEAMAKESERMQTDNDKMHFSYKSRGYYLQQYEAFEKCFGSQNIKVILFEDFINDTHKNVKSISEFIGLSECYYETDQVSNPASSPRLKVVQDVLYKDNPIKKAIGKLIPSKDIKRKIAQNIEGINLKASKKEKLSETLKNQLFETYYANHVSELEHKLQINLSAWKQ